MKAPWIGPIALLVALVAAIFAWRESDPRPATHDRTAAPSAAPIDPGDALTPARESPQPAGPVATSDRSTTGRDPADMPRPGPMSAPAPPLRWLSAEDEAKLDAFAISLETGSGPRGRKDPTVAEYNARFEQEERDPAWAGVREDAIRAVLEERRGQLADVRVGEPVCKASICLMRAIIESIDNDRLGAWSRASERLLIPPIIPGAFDGASTSFERVDGETVALSYLFRREPPGD